MHSRYLQISAPVQPGNSGGPLLDASGHLVGIVTSKLNAANVARYTGDIPQNVNFAIKAEVARTFLDSKGIAYRTVRSDQQLSPADVGDLAQPFTLYIEFRQAATRSVAIPTTPSRPEPTASNGVAEDVAEMISQYRHEHGLSTVKTDAQLTAIAERQARAMAASGTMDHSVAGPFASRVAGAHTGPAAENIAAGTKTWTETFLMWQAGPGHNANLLQSKADSVGIAVARNDQNSLQDFLGHDNCRQIEKAMSRLLRAGRRRAGENGVRFNPEHANRSAVPQDCLRSAQVTWPTAEPFQVPSGAQVDG